MHDAHTMTKQRLLIITFHNAHIFIHKSKIQIIILFFFLLVCPPSTLYRQIFVVESGGEERSEHDYTHRKATKKINANEK